MIRKVLIDSDSLIFGGTYYSENQEERRIIMSQQEQQVPELSYGSRSINFEFSCPYFQDDIPLYYSYVITSYSIHYTKLYDGLLSPLSDSDGRIELPFSLPYGIDKNDGISVGFETTDGSVLTQDIHYFNDGTDKELVVQNAVRTNAGFSWDRTAQSDDFIVYWGEKISGDPTDPVNGSLVFDPQEVMATLSSILSFIRITSYNVCYTKLLRRGYR